MINSYFLYRRSFSFSLATKSDWPLFDCGFTLKKRVSPNILSQYQLCIFTIKTHSGDTESTPKLTGTTEGSVNVEAVTCEHQPWKKVCSLDGR